MDRKLLVMGVFALVVMAGCIGGGGNGSSGDVNVIEFVPNENVDGVFHVDMAILEDQTTENLANTLIEMSKEDNPNYDGPENYEDIWSEFDQGTDTEFDPRDLNEVVVFTKVPEESAMAQDEDLGAAILSADLTEDEMVSLVEQNATVEAGEYSGVPFYTVESEDDFGETETNYMAVLQDGVYSFGQEGPVRSTVDVSQGNADALSGELREELDRVRDGYINFAVTIPEETFNNTGMGGGPGQGSQFSAFREISVVSGSYYTEGENMGLSANMRAGNAEDAQNIADAIDGLVSLGEMTYGENASAILGPLETETDESTVIVTYETTVDDLVENIEALEQSMTGPGAGPGAGPGGSGATQPGGGFGGSSGGEDFGSSSESSNIPSRETSPTGSNGGEGSGT